MNKKLFIAGLVALVALSAAVYGFKFLIPKNEIKGIENNNIVGGDRDEHGCIGSAGYMWCQPKNKCLRIWEESCYSSPEQEIQYQLARKYDKLISEVTVTATKKTADYMAGSISFAPGAPGGIFLAAKEGSLWTLVYEGNGSIDCKNIKENYNFPPDMLKGFCD
ncbi:MAG: hypothetical protein WC459_03160 [Patescibacteria group bacterium]